MNSSATLTGCDDIIKRLRSISRTSTTTEPQLADICVTRADVAALLYRLEAAERENERLRKFAGKVLDKSREEFLELSCADIEDWAKQFGLLELVTMAAACGAGCKCPEWVGFPLECLRPTALGSAAIDAARAAEPSDEV